MPDAFDNRSFLAFGSLRSFPLQQWRKLSTALHGRLLPFAEIEVQTLIRQAMYQVGDLSDDSEPMMEWQRELLETDGLETLITDLDIRANRLEQTPREHRSIRILGEMAAFLSQFNPTNGIVLVRRYSNVALFWANNHHKEMLKKTSVISNEFRVKECLMLGYSLLCYSKANLKMEDAAMLCELIVRFYIAQLLTSSISDYAELQAEINAIRVPCQYVTSRKFRDILPLVLKDPNRTLTPAVQAIFTRAPVKLNWTRLRVGNNPTTCFEASGADEDYYIINIITGRLLLNGAPPGGLARRILKDPLYRRSFGNRDFEVSSGSKGMVFKTVRELNGYFYEFEDRGASGPIVIREIPCDNKSCLVELIKVTKDASQGEWISCKHNMKL
jgi:hypothetical protein